MREPLFREVMNEQSDGGPEGRDQQAGEHQAFGELQAGGGFRLLPAPIRQMVCPIEFPKPSKSPHKPSTIS